MSGHIITRNGRFSWRRVIGGVAIQVPLRTSDPKVAREVGAVATSASYAVFFDIAHRGLDRTAGKRIIERATAVASARLTLREEEMFFFPFPFESARSMRERGFSESAIRTWIRGRLHKPTDEDLRGWDPEDIAEYKAILDDKPYYPPQNTNSGQRSVVINHHHHYAPPAQETRRHTSAEVTPESASPDIRKVKAQAPEHPDGRDLIESPPDRTPIPDLVETIIASDLRRNRVNEATAKGFRTSVALFCEICRINDVEEITQDKLHKFCETLERIPPNYRRGAKGRATPIFVLIEEAERDGAETGLSPKTVNKQLEAVKKLIRHASTKVNLPPLEVSILRVRDNKSAKEKRMPFTREEIRKLFALPGLNLSSERNALFWNAHLAVYTGARREELAGLETDDVIEQSGVPVILIRSNSHRTLKNGQSERFVPIHPDLIELGFLDYVASRGPGLLFDIRKKGKTYGNFFEYSWQKVRKAVVGNDDKKTYHSFRHSAVQALIDAEVPLHVRADLFGHDHEHIQGNVYGGKSKETTLLEAVKLLPSVR